MFVSVMIMFKILMNETIINTKRRKQRKKQENKTLRHLITNDGVVNAGGSYTR